jgi:predicted metal-dependent HD superfamily phosphohydrolase
MDFPKAKDYILDRLSSELSLDYYYHDVGHTIDVLRSTTRLARLEGLSEHDQRLVETAALFHDAGMLRTYKGHEGASSDIVKEVLPGFGYDPEEVEMISNMILTTQLPQHAKTHLEQVLCDADLDYLGRQDFFMIAHRLRHEWNLLNVIPTTLKQWYELQIEFMNDHNFYTHSAKVLRDQGKENNLNLIKELLNHK